MVIAVHADLGLGQGGILEEGPGAFQQGAFPGIEREAQEAFAEPVIEQRQLSDAGQAIELLQTVFGIDVPAGAALHARLAALWPAARPA